MSESRKIRFFCVILLLSFIFAFVFILTSCETQERKEWDEIKDVGSIEDLLDFAGDYKGGRLVGEINKKIREELSSEDDLKFLVSLIEKYPDREYEFKDRISEIALNSALDENTPDALEEYIDAFSDYGKDLKYIDQAEESLKNINFNAAKEQKSIGLLEEFILRYENHDKVMCGEAAKLIKEITEENGWNDALLNYESDNSILMLINFTEAYPDSVYTPEAEKIIKKVRNDSSYSEKYFSEPTLDLIDEFISNFPGHKDIDKAYKIREDFVGDIYSMIEKGYIDAVATGDTITRCRIYIANHTKSRLEITIPFGAYFAANSGFVQNMLALEEKTFNANPEKTGSTYINTACMNIYKDIPDDRNYFIVEMLDEDSPLIKLLKILAENSSSYEVAQAAIWQVTDNPGRDTILGALKDDETGEYAITEEDYAEAVRLIELAGIE